ncbi:MAG: hypothetical protein ACFFAN_12300 [Promethearchaeota archaeon]
MSTTNKKIVFISIILSSLIIISVNLAFQTLVSGDINVPNTTQESKRRGSVEEIKTSTESGGGYTMDTGASYSWEEISTTGNLMEDISDEDDDYEQILFSEAGWNFTYYETEYNTIYVSSNGWMSFTNEGETDDVIEKIPNNYISENHDCVALLCIDLDPSEGGNIYYQFETSPNRLIIEYKDVYSCDGEDLLGTFEVIFYQTGDIKFQYKNIYNLYNYEAIVGLDHGDLINYDSYTEINMYNLPISSLAIEFTFDEMDDFKCQNGGGYIIDPDADYSWIEINNTIGSTRMDHISDNWFSYEQILFSDGWYFTYYETEYNTIYVSSNGWMSFTNEEEASSWLYGIPRVDNKNIDAVAPLSILLNTSYGGDISYYFGGTNPNRYLVIEYCQVYDYWFNELVGDFEVIFYENGTIKFQYKNVDVSRIFIGTNIGLDHGDLTNYNYYYTPFDLSSKAFEFTFSEMSEVVCTLGFEENDEFIWEVWEVNRIKMEDFFGINWEENFGLFPNMDEDEKTKIRISSISETSTEWIINYETWDWIDNDDDFDNTPEGEDQLIYFKDPSDYTEQHNLSNLIPFLLPKNPTIYLGNANASDFYDDIVYDFGWLVLTCEPDAYVEIEARYNPNGVLDELEIAWEGSEDEIFGMEFEYHPTNDGDDDDNDDDDDKNDDINDNDGDAGVVISFLLSPIGLITIGGIITAGFAIIACIWYFKKKGLKR